MHRCKEKYVGIYIACLKNKTSGEAKQALVDDRETAQVVADADAVGTNAEAAVDDDEVARVVADVLVYTDVQRLVCKIC